MTHQLRIRADRLLAVPLAVIFNLLARLMGALMHRDHSVTGTNVKRIIIAKLIGMGSILQSVSLLRALKQRYPQCRITFVTLHSNLPLVRRIADVDEVLTLDDGSIVRMLATTTKAIVAMIRLRADLYF